MNVALYFKPEVQIPTTLPCTISEGQKYHIIGGPVELVKIPGGVTAEMIDMFATRTNLRAGNYRFSGEYRLGKAKAVVQTQWHYVGSYEYEFYTRIHVSSHNLGDLQRLFSRILAGTIWPTIWYPGGWYNPVAWLGRTFNTLRVIFALE